MPQFQLSLSEISLIDINEISKYEQVMIEDILESDSIEELPRFL